MTKQEKERESLKQSVFRRLTLEAKRSALLHKVQILQGRRVEIDKKLLALQSSRLSLEFEENNLKADHDVLERERIALAKMRFPSLSEAEQVALAKEAMKMFSKGGQG